MSYIIYADEMIVWNTFINIAVISISSAILKEIHKPVRCLVFSFFTAIVTTLEYIITFGVNKYIYHITYAVIYLIMIGIYHQTCRHIFKHLVVYFFAAIILYGCMGIVFINQISSVKKGILLTSGVSIITVVIILYSKRNLSAKGNEYRVNLNINDKKISLNGYVDTGNTLTDPYTGMPVIILDYKILKEILPSSAYEIILKYHKTGDFDYMYLQNECNIKFYPIPYKTISTDFALIPAFKIKSLVFTDLNYQVDKIVCGISRYRLKNNNEYQVLLNESLKPNRKEKFK